MRIHPRQIIILAVVAITAIASSSTVARSQTQRVGSFRSIAECEAAMQALLRSGRISWYHCYPVKKDTQIYSLPFQRQLRVNAPSRQLEKKWSHSNAFDIKTSKKNSSTIARYRQAIVSHLKSPQTLAYGTYPRVRGSKVYYNPITNLVVILDREGNFVSGWRLTPGETQFRRYISEGILE
jgi:hypothetical protein